MKLDLEGFQYPCPIRGRQASANLQYDRIGMRAAILLTFAMVAACGQRGNEMDRRDNVSGGGRAVVPDFDTVGPKSFRGQDLSGYDIPVFYPASIPTMTMDRATGDTIDTATGEVLSITSRSGMGQHFHALIRQSGHTVVQLEGQIGTGFKPGFGKTTAYVVELAYRGDVLNPSDGRLGRDKLKLDRVADFLGNNMSTIGLPKYVGNVVVLDGRDAKVRYVES